MFWGFLEAHKYVWSMVKKKEKPKDYDHQPADRPPKGDRQSEHQRKMAVIKINNFLINILTKLVKTTTKK